MMQTLSKIKMSLIASLSMKKFRLEHKLFIAEGHKIVSEIINSDYVIRYLIYNGEREILSYAGDFEVFVTDDAGMKKISNLKTPQTVLVVVEIPQDNLDIALLNNKLTMCIDDIQDPGNLGTIIRICDWFGIENLVCSQNSVDIYNPKVVQATMGALLRVKVHYLNLSEFIPQYISETRLPCFGTFLDGENIYKTDLPEAALFVLGNEGSGISTEIEELLNRRLFIPPFLQNEQHAESLNIASAASVICSEFRRRISY